MLGILGNIETSCVTHINHDIYFLVIAFIYPPLLLENKELAGMQRLHSLQSLTDTRT